MNGIFDIRPDTAYNDKIGHRYHFPNKYLAVAKNIEKDWVIFREPRRGGGRQGYVAVGWVSNVELDQDNPKSHSYARITYYLVSVKKPPFLAIAKRSKRVFFIIL